MGPAILFTIGTLLLLESLRVAGFHRTWPIILLVVGAVKLIQSANPRIDPGANYPGAGPGHSGGGFVPPPPAPLDPTPTEVKPSEVNNG
jgi:hypothetical protein